MSFSPRAGSPACAGFMAQSQYISVAELADTIDRRNLRKLASDQGADGEISSSNTILTSAIERASADVQSHALRGGAVSTDDLDDLQAADDWTLKGVVADLAIVYIFQRRGAVLPESVSESLERAQQTLQDLRDGKRVFNLSTQIAAGRGSVAVISESDRGRLNLVSDQPFFPTRQTQVQ